MYIAQIDTNFSLIKFRNIIGLGECDANNFGVDDEGYFFLSGRLSVIAVGGGYIEQGLGYNYSNNRSRFGVYFDWGWGVGIDIGASVPLTQIKPKYNENLAITNINGWANSNNYTAVGVYSNGSNYKNWVHILNRLSPTDKIYNTNSIGFGGIGVGYSFTKGKTFLIWHN